MNPECRDSVPQPAADQPLTHHETVAAVEDRNPPIEANTRWQIRGSGGEHYVIRILAAHPDGGWIYDTVRRAGKPPIGRELGVIPEYNLRRIYRPEDETAD